MSIPISLSYLPTACRKGCNTCSASIHGSFQSVLRPSRSLVYIDAYLTTCTPRGERTPKNPPSSPCNRESLTGQPNKLAPIKGKTKTQRNIEAPKLTNWPLSTWPDNHGSTLASILSHLLLNTEANLLPKSPYSPPPCCQVPLPSKPFTKAALQSRHLLPRQSLPVHTSLR